MLPVHLSTRRLLRNPPPEGLALFRSEQRFDMEMHAIDGSVDLWLEGAPGLVHGTLVPAQHTVDGPELG